VVLKESFIWKGYLPENVPPTFFSADVGDFLSDDRSTAWWSEAKSPVRPATYNASKRGITRRTFSVVHPTTMRDLTKFLVMRWDAIGQFLAQIDCSLSVPREMHDGDRAIEISTHSQVDAAKIARLSQYRFIAKTDISRFYHSIYTHSIPWAFHGKDRAKADRHPNSATVFLNRADHILRCGQDGQTVGIPVGPDTSRVLAEIVATAIDLEFRKRCDVEDITVIRHVDDVWIGANSHADAESALWRYREAIREFELDINESKTRIYSSDFRFADAWPTELSVALETALDSRPHQKSDRLRAALEQAFAMTVTSGDDGILKYVIRYLDRHDAGWENWEIVEPLLKRSVVHYGHTVDYVARVIVWRLLTKGDLDRQSWSRILAAIIDRHGRIGNDSEVCWATYASARLGCPIAAATAQNIVRNCGALSILSILNCADNGLTDTSIFDVTHERMRLESGRGTFWPVIMEWKSRQWPRHAALQGNNEMIDSLVSHGAILFNMDRLPLVFTGVEENKFDEVERAIEDKPTMYDDDEDEEDGLDENELGGF
jgi:hypothetical protein